MSKQAARTRKRKAQKNYANQPIVGEGRVDPDFDDLEAAEAELIESVGAHRDQSEDSN